METHSNSERVTSKSKPIACPSNFKMPCWVYVAVGSGYWILVSCSGEIWVIGKTCR